ncbi:MAG: hypothetical protein K6L80_12130 [Agarilytica sp.]
MNKVIVIIVAIFTISCASQLKDDLNFTVGVKEVAPAIVKFRKSKNNMLFLFLVDDHGKIAKSKIIETKFPIMTDRTKRRIELKLVRTLDFGAKASEGKEYREIFHAIKYTESMYTY